MREHPGSGPGVPADGLGGHLRMSPNLSEPREVGLLYALIHSELGGRETWDNSGYLLNDPYFF